MALSFGSLLHMWETGTNITAPGSSLTQPGSALVNEVIWNVKQLESPSFILSLCICIQYVLLCVTLITKQTHQGVFNKETL